jgi:hypothetical protein
MVQKPIAISVIAPVVLAGILILSGLAAIPSIHRSQASGGCDLTISADPSKGSLAAGESIGVKLSGELSCGGSGMVNYPIYIAAYSPTPPGPLQHVVGYVNTVVNGNYHTNILVKAGTHETIKATFDMRRTDPNYYTSASTTIDIKEKSGGRFTPS